MNISIHLTHPQVKYWNFSPGNLNILHKALPDAHIGVYSSSKEFVESLGTANVALVWSFEQEWFALSPCLEWIVTPAAGKDYFAVTPPSHVSIDYCSFHGRIMAETVIGMILFQIRGIGDSFRLMPKEPWPRSEFEKNMRSFHGSHLVILGFGNIGHWIAGLSKPFGVRITGIKRTNGPVPDYFDADDRVLPVSDLDDVLPEADHLVIALPAKDDTNDIIDARRIKLLPKHAFIYNIGRGNAIEEKALAASLNRGDIAGAFLDVFKTEPLPMDSELRTSAHVMLMPHASAISPDYLDLFVDEFIQKYKARYPSTGK